MWRLALLVIALVGAATSTNESSVHTVFRITPKNEEQLEFLRSFRDDGNSGWTFWRGPSTVSKPADLMVSPHEQSNFISFMESHGIAYKVLIDNVERLLAESNRKTRLRSRGHHKKTFDWTRYHNLTEINNWLDTLVKEFPAYVEPVIGGRSEQGRQIRGVKLSFGGADIAAKAGIFVEGGSHAREWISPATVTYILDQLLRSDDPKVRDLAEAHDWYIFPVFNPDGYDYTHQNPKNMRNRFWRKTRSANNSNCQGTDMNRNWAYQWNVVGASKDPCSETFAGTAAFSTIESRTLSHYITSISDKLFAYLSFHSFSQYLMFPYGHTDMPMDNYDEELAIAESAVEALSRRYGTEYWAGSIAELVGFVSGSSVDWVKATFKLPLVFAYELADSGDKGFLLPPDQIIPNGQEVLDSLLALFQEAQAFGYPRQS